MNGLNFIDAAYIDQITVKRRGEPRLGEVLSLITSKQALEDSKARYLLIGIPEDIGVRANGGRPGTEKTWDAFLSHFCSLPVAKNSPIDKVAILGTIACQDLIKQSLDLDWRNTNDQKTFDALITTLDQRVSQVIEPLISAGFIPVVIGGGHNNALGLLTGSSQALKQAINCLNIDAHTDLRSDDYRHSGNGFQRAIQTGALKNYGIFGLHEHTLSPGITEFMDQTNMNSNGNINSGIDYLSLNQWLDTALAMRHDKFDRWVQPVLENHFGLEIDLDVIADMGSSAQNPSGLCLEDVRRVVRSMAGNKYLRYVHLCEGAPELGLYPTQVVKTLSALCLDFLV